MATEKKYILVMCDTSNFWGFLAIPIYYKAALKGGYELVFVMTYPHFLDNNMKNNANSPVDIGLGMNGSVKNLSEIDDDLLLINQNLKTYNPTQSGKKSSLKKGGSDGADKYQRSIAITSSNIILIMLNLCKQYNNNDIVNAHFVNTYAYNSIQPIDLKKTFSEVSNLLKESISTYKFDDITKITNMSQLITSEKIIIMNGSMAWFNDKNLTKNKTKFCKTIKKCIVVGGILEDKFIEKDTETTNILTGVNRKQAYHPEATGDFFKTMALLEKTELILFINDNEINSNFSFDIDKTDANSYYSFKMMMSLVGLIPYSEEHVISKLFDIYYKQTTNKTIEKPADLIAALYLWDFLNTDNNDNNIKKHLNYHPKYGTVILSDNESIHQPIKFTDNISEQNIYKESISGKANLEGKTPIGIEQSIFIKPGKINNKYNYLGRIYTILICEANDLSIVFKYNESDSNDYKDGRLSEVIIPDLHRPISAVSTIQSGGKKKNKRVIRRQFINKKERDVYKIKGCGNTLYVDINRKMVKYSSCKL